MAADRQKSFPLFVGLRYSLGKNPNQLVSFLSRLSMAGLILGAGLLIVVLSVMNGFDREMRTRILALVPHLTVTPWVADEAPANLGELLVRHPGVEAWTPFTQFPIMLVRGQQLLPALLYGVDPDREPDVSILGNYIDLPALARSEAAANQIYLGAALAKQLGVSSGDGINLVLPGGQGSGSQVRFQRLQLAGIIHTGTELDQNLAVMHIDHAQAIHGESPVGVRLRLADVFDAPLVGWELRNQLDSHYMMQSWTQQFGNMYEAIQMSRRLVVIMLLAVIAVAVFNVVSTLVMVVNDKQGDIAILRSQGATQRQILLIFISYGAAIGLFGAGLGGALGVVLSVTITDAVVMIEQAAGFQFLQSDVYPISYLPSDLRWGDVALVCGVAYLMSLLATLYPAWRASRVAPAEALRYQ